MNYPQTTTRAGFPSREGRKAGARARAAAFALLEISVAVSIVAIGFLGLYATSLQAGKMSSAAEEEALVMSGLEERIDALRLLQWPELTDGTGITTKVWTARPESVAGLGVLQETLTLSPSDLAGVQTLQGTWNDGFSPTINFTAGGPLNTAGAVKTVATLRWRGRRSNRIQTRSLVTVISRGGISKSEPP